jgi:hypothetical protein
VVDLWILALGFGFLPIVALVLAAAPTFLRRHETILWGLLIGVVAFLGFAHAGSALLEGNAYLRYEATPEISAATASGGLLLGISLGWMLLGRRGAPGSVLGGVAAAAASYVALHSVADGLVLGEAYAGPLATGYSLTAIIVGGTLLHRFAEGALIVVPAVLAASKPRRWLSLLLVGLLTLPAAYVPVAILTGNPSPAAFALDQGVSVFVAGVEAGFAGLFLFLGLLPRVADAKDRRWAVWAGLAFTAMLLIHFLVE